MVKVLRYMQGSWEREIRHNCIRYSWQFL
jgi:hypothetical protein